MTQVFVVGNPRYGQKTWELDPIFRFVYAAGLKNLGGAQRRRMAVVQQLNAYRVPLLQGHQ